MRAITATAASLVLATTLLSVAEVDAGRNRVDLYSFMTGLACVESGGRYDVFNSRTGAIGKYQIMPGNWVAWAGRYMRNRWAPATPRNQEFVARMRIQQLYQKHGSWDLVAHWWLTGNAPLDVNTWSPGASRYTQKVMGVAQAAASPAFAADIKERCFPGDFEDPKIRTEPFPRVVIRGHRVNVRLAPGYENRPVDTVRRGDILPVLARGSDPRGKQWLKVGLHAGRTGWIASWFAVSRD
jgi:hypothetical protein